MSAKSHHGVATGTGVSRSSAERTCPRCGRGGAIVTRRLSDREVTICRWVDSDKCDDPGTVRWFPSQPLEGK